MTRKFLLPAGLDQEGRLRACRELCRTFQRSNLVTTGRVVGVLPGERGWVEQSGNDAQPVFYAHIKTRRAKSESRSEQFEMLRPNRRVQ
jgi:hypothetical protein